MPDDIRIFAKDGGPAAYSEAQQELVEAIRRTGDPALLGDWTEQIIPKSATQMAGSSNGKITLDLHEYLDAFDARQLYDRIAAFQKEIDAAGTSEEIRNRLHPILFPTGLRSAVLPLSSVTVPALRAPLYRVRANISDPSDVKSVGGVSEFVKVNEASGS